MFLKLGLANQKYLAHLERQLESSGLNHVTYKNVIVFTNMIDKT